MNRSKGRNARNIALFFAVSCVIASLARCAVLAPSRHAEPAVPEIAGDPARAAEAVPEALPAPSPLVLTFAGDIMAHRCNYSMAEYDRIYDDLRDFLRSDDLSFANLEMPVVDSLPLSTYPRFNVHAPYPQAAIRGGFDVFSLANNHANDQGAGGISATLSAVSGLEGLAGASGLRAKSEDAMEPLRIRAKDTDVIFLAVTEILNSYDASRRLVYYVAPRDDARDDFVASLREIRAANPEALFVLSLHSNEPEYVRTAGKAKREWFARLAEAGVDVIWAHHPHVMQEWETLTLGGRETLVMYSMGNFISGQRWDTDPAHPEAYREYTGDAVLLRVSAAKADRGFRYGVNPVAVSNWRDPRSGMVVRAVSETFLASLSQAQKDYYRARWRLMGAYLPLLPLPD